MVSGLPGSGKTSLAHRLAPVVGLPVIDKDDILERLFAARGVGDAAWRTTLSRESDLIFRSNAAESSGAILVSFWHQAGMDAQSGTATEWLQDLSPCIVNLHCDCPAEIAAERFLLRKRHPGHLDQNKSHAETVASLTSISQLAPLPIPDRIVVDTSEEVDIERLADKLELTFQNCARRSRAKR